MPRTHKKSDVGNISALLPQQPTQRDEQIQELQADVKALRKWTGRHENRHGDDAAMLGRVLDDLKDHTNNHHGRTSELKRGASIGTVLGLIAVVTEIIRRFLL